MNEIEIEKLREALRDKNNENGLESLIKSYKEQQWEENKLEKVETNYKSGR
jgi:hypothetical protein